MHSGFKRVCFTRRLNSKYRDAKSLDHIQSFCSHIGLGHCCCCGSCGISKGNSVANDSWNNRIIQAFADKHGGTEVGWQSQINMGLQMMKEKMKCERIMSEFLDGNPRLLTCWNHTLSVYFRPREMCGASKLVRLPVIVADMAYSHQVLALDKRMPRKTLREWYGLPESCRLGKFWTTIALMNIAEGYATGADWGAEQVQTAYLKVVSRVGYGDLCKGNLMTKKEMDNAATVFKAARKKTAWFHIFILGGCCLRDVVYQIVDSNRNAHLTCRDAGFILQIGIVEASQLVPVTLQT